MGTSPRPSTPSWTRASAVSRSASPLRRPGPSSHRVALPRVIQCRRPVGRWRWTPCGCFAAGTIPIDGRLAGPSRPSATRSPRSGRTSPPSAPAGRLPHRSVARRSRSRTAAGAMVRPGATTRDPFGSRTRFAGSSSARMGVVVHASRAVTGSGPRPRWIRLRRSIFVHRSHGTPITEAGEPDRVAVSRSMTTANVGRAWWREWQRGAPPDGVGLGGLEAAPAAPIAPTTIPSAVTGVPLRWPCGTSARSLRPRPRPHRSRSRAPDTGHAT